MHLSNMRCLSAVASEQAEQDFRGCKYLWHMTSPSPEPSSCLRPEGTHDSEMASEPELSSRGHAATGDIASCRSGAPPEAPLSILTSAPQNASNELSQSDVSAIDSSSKLSDVADSDVADGTVHDTGARHVNIEELPDEILIKIFSHMSFSELVDVIQKVCPRWKRLSQDFELWTDKEYQIGTWRYCGLHTIKVGMTDEEAIQTFCDVPNLRKLRMWRGAKSGVFRALCNNCHRLSELYLHHARPLSYSVLKNLVEKCCGIHTLSIYGELLKSEKFSEVVSHLGQLRVLELHVNCTETIPVLRPLGDHCPHLNDVNLWDTVVDMDDLRHFLNAKRNTLKTLRIKWTMAGKKCVPPLLTVCAESLERLELYDFDVIRDEAREAFTALGNMKNLRELTMKIPESAPPGTAALAFKTGGLPKLRLLDLRQGYGLDDSTVIAVSHGCPTLRELYISDAGLLSDAAFSQIHRLKHLEILDLSCCVNLGGALFPCLARLPQLHTLLMEGFGFPRLQPGLSSILELSSVRCLSFKYSIVTEVPFDKFPGKLINLRELRIQGCRGDPKATDGLTEQMPDLKIDGSIDAEVPASGAEDHEDYEEPEEEENGDNAGPGDAEEVRDDWPERGEDGGGDTEGDNVIWDESSISILSILFLEDV